MANLIDLGKFNCKFLSSSLKHLYEGICVAFIVPLFEMTVVMIVCACFLKALAHAAFKVAMNSTRKKPKKEKDTNAPNDPN